MDLLNSHVKGIPSGSVWHNESFLRDLHAVAAPEIFNQRVINRAVNKAEAIYNLYQSQSQDRQSQRFNSPGHRQFICNNDQVNGEVPMG